jgi:hypothetical protein
MSNRLPYAQRIVNFFHSPNKKTHEGGSFGSHHPHLPDSCSAENGLHNTSGRE